MHLNFPRKRDFWTWEELGCLAKTLGFQMDLFYRNTPKDKREACKKGLKPKQIDDLLETKALSPDLHRTFNMHDAAYNMKVIQKSMQYLSSHSLSFQQIKEARLAFQLYEHMDNAGLVINDHTIRRTLKMCGRAISPLKLSQHLKHMDRLVPDRLMFYEFIEILLVSEKLSDVQNNVKENSSSEKTMKDNRNLFELCDFNDVLLTEDEKMSKKLNELHQRDLERIPVRKSHKNADKQEKPWLVPSIVDHETREILVKKNKEQTEVLREQLDMSNDQVLLKSSLPSCGCKQPETVNGDTSQKKFLLNEDDERVGDISYVTSRNPSTSKNLNTQNSKRNRENFQSPIVTAQDLNSTSIAIEEMKWQIATQGEKMRHFSDSNVEKKYDLVSHATTIPELEEKPRKNSETKTKHNPTRSLTKLIKDEKPELAQKFAARIRDTSMKLEETIGDEDSAIESNKVDEKKKMTVEERLHQIDQKLEKVCLR